MVTVVDADVVPVEVAEKLAEELAVDEADIVMVTLCVLEPESVAELVPVLN